jgi:hypothetical protein
LLQKVKFGILDRPSGGWSAEIVVVVEVKFTVLEGRGVDFLRGGSEERGGGRA